MTGPEHYREAERLLAAAQRDRDEIELKAAHVHAMLAVAAASVTGQVGMTYEPIDGPTWTDVMGS